MSRYSRTHATDAIHYGYRDDGHFGCDIKELCSKGYSYVGNGKGCNNAYMAVYDPGVKQDYTRDDALDGFTDLGGVCHFIASKSITKQPKHRTKGMSARVDLTIPGVNFYTIPQIMKHSYVSPEQYFTESSEKRSHHRTRRTVWKNDWERNKIRGELKKAEYLYEKYGKEYDHAAFEQRMAATREGDEYMPLTGRCGYCEKDVLAYTNIVLDIDDHEDPVEWVQQMADRLEKILINGCDENGEILDVKVLPHMVVKTGRGLQLYFRIKPVYYPAASMVRKAAEALCDEYDHICEKYGTNLTVDRRASMDIAGFKRFIGSYNSRAVDHDGRWRYHVTKRVSKIISQEPADIKTLFGLLGLRLFTDEEKAACKKNREKAERKHRYTDRGLRFTKFFNDYARNIFAGCRNYFIFYASTMAKEAGMDVYDYAMELNKKMPHPLSDREVEKTAKSVINHDYHPTNRNISQMFGFTDEELSEYGLSAEGKYVKNEDRKAACLAKRKMRDERVIRLLRQGKSITETSEIMGLCRATVRRIKDRFHEAIERIKDRNLSCRKSMHELIAGMDDHSYVCQDSTKEGFDPEGYRVLTL